MGHTAKISPHVPSSYVQHAFLSVQMIHIIPSFQLYGAIDNSSLVPSGSCHTSRTISGITCVQPTIFPMRQSCKAMAVSVFFTRTNFEPGFKLPEF